MKLAMRKGAVLLLLRLSAFLSSPISLGKRTYYIRTYVYIYTVHQILALIALSGRAIASWYFAALLKRVLNVSLFQELSVILPKLW